MCLLSFAGFLRYNELSSLRCKDITIHDSHIDIFIYKSKTDQYRDGNNVVIARWSKVTCPVGNLVKYISCSDIKLDLILFRGV